MGKLKTFFWSQWEDIKGNVKYAVLSFLIAGGGLASLAGWLTQYIQKIRGAPLQDRLGYEILVVLCFCALMLSAILLYLMILRERRLQDAEPALRQAANQVVTQSVKIPEPPGPVPEVDLQGEILELYISNLSPFFPVGQQQILMKARIVNRGPSDTTITQSALRVELGSFRRQGTPIKIPANLRIKREREGAFMMTAFDEFPLEPALGISTTAEVYKRGIPHEGWLAFEVYGHGAEEFPNAQFDLMLADSLGGSHVIRRAAGVYRATGELIRANQSALPN